MNKDEILPVGKIAGVHGIKGEVKLFPYGDLDDMRWGQAFFTAKKRKIECRVLRARRHKGVYILEIEGTTTRNDAEALVGFELSVPRGALPEPGEDEFYYTDLVGMEVLTDRGEDLGRITDIIPTGGNDVLEVHGARGEVLIPATTETILKVDEEKKTVTVRLLEGLLPGE